MLLFIRSWRLSATVAHQSCFFGMGVSAVILQSHLIRSRCDCSAHFRPDIGKPTTPSDYMLRTTPSWLASKWKYIVSLICEPFAQCKYTIVISQPVGNQASRLTVSSMTEFFRCDCGRGGHIWIIIPGAFDVLKENKTSMSTSNQPDVTKAGLLFELWVALSIFVTEECEGQDLCNEMSASVYIN